MLIEGEEEIGSEHLEEFIKENTGLLKCDVAIISDTSMYDKDVPAIGYALRGLCYMQVDVPAQTVICIRGSMAAVLITLSMRWLR